MCLTPSSIRRALLSVSRLNSRPPRRESLSSTGTSTKTIEAPSITFTPRWAASTGQDCVRLHFFDGTVSYDEARTISRAPTTTGGPLFRLHRIETDHRRHFGKILALSRTCGWVPADELFNPYTMSTCSVTDFPFGDSLPWPSTLTSRCVPTCAAGPSLDITALRFHNIANTSCMT